MWHMRRSLDELDECNYVNTDRASIATVIVLAFLLGVLLGRLLGLALLADLETTNRWSFAAE